MWERAIQLWQVLLLSSSLLTLPGLPFRVQAPTERYLVTIHSSVTDPPAAARLLAARYQLTLHHTFQHTLTGFSASGTARSIASLRANPQVVAVEHSHTGELAGFAGGQAAPMARQAGQVVPAGVRRVGADRSPIARIDGIDTPLDVDIAVIDSGIEANHPDLNIAGSVVCSGGQASVQPATDLSGHGTAVAGVIAAKDNALGVVGVAPGARLWSVRVAHRTPDNHVRYHADDVLCGVEWVVAHAQVIEVANLSLGAYAPQGLNHGTCGQGNASIEAALHRAICAAVAAGVTFVVAAGEPRATMPRTDTAYVSPASFDEVITVSAMADFDGQAGGRSKLPACVTSDKDDTFWDESNYGLAVDLVAPGVCISTTSESMWTGTSFSAPHVAGAAALYKIAHPAAAPAEVKRALVAMGQRGWNVNARAGQPSGDDPDGTTDPLLTVLGWTAGATPTRSQQSSPTGTPSRTVVQRVAPNDQ